MQKGNTNTEVVYYGDINPTDAIILSVYTGRPWLGGNSVEIHWWL